MTEMNTINFIDYVRQISSGECLKTDDILSIIIPLFRQVQKTHENGYVAPLDNINEVKFSLGQLWYEEGKASEPKKQFSEINKIDKKESKTFEVVGGSCMTSDEGNDSFKVEHSNLLIKDEAINKPVYLPNYLCWEHKIDHHDELTDIFSLGLILASLSCGLDFSDVEDLQIFVSNRENLFRINPELNPVVAKAIMRMTELSRHKRSQDLDSIINNLEKYREQDFDYEFDISKIEGFHKAELKDKRQIIQSRLRDRLFEISKRNRLIYFKPSLQSLNMTEASIPILLDYKHIRPQQIFFWYDDISRQIIQKNNINLNSFLRFEDIPFISSSLNNIRLSNLKDKAEFGFSQLRLVICFLKWYNLKEEPDIRIESPLLLLPVELLKKKGIRDIFTMQPLTDEAEVNPALRYYLNKLYGLNLPETVDLSEVTLQKFYEVLKEQIQASEPGITFNLIDKPRIEIIYTKAKKRVEQYRKKLRLSAASFLNFDNIDYSYDKNNFRPLGLQLFLRKIKPSPSQLSSMIGDSDEPKPKFSSPKSFVNLFDNLMPKKEDKSSEDENVKEKQMYTLSDSSFGNPYIWEFDLCSITLGNFNYRKMTLVRDYYTLIENAKPNQPFDSIFLMNPDASRFETPTKPDIIPVNELYPIVRSDPTQISAILKARTNKSYIIQGPPGTGKSQTITNLIGDYVARNKRVLFVCEKRAAIDVVFHRLKQQKLDELCCLIHDSQKDKREFIQDLKNTYEKYLKNPEPISRYENARNEILAAIDKELNILKTFTQCMKNAYPQIGIELRKLYNRLINLKDILPNISAIDAENLPQYSLWNEHGNIVNKLANILKEIGQEPIFASHPIKHLNKEIINAEKPLQSISEYLINVNKYLEKLMNNYSEIAILKEIPEQMKYFSELSKYVHKLLPLAEKNLIQILKMSSDEAKTFSEFLKNHKKLIQELEEIKCHTQFWKDKMSPEELPEALELARRLEKSYIKILRPSYWNLRKNLKRRFNFSLFSVMPRWTWILERLDAEYKTQSAIDKLNSESSEQLGIDNIAEFNELLNETKAFCKSLSPEIEKLHKRILKEDSPSSIFNSLKSFIENYDTLEETLKKFLVSHLEFNFLQLHDVLKAIEDNLNFLPDFIPILKELYALPENFYEPIRNFNFTPEQFEAAIGKCSLDNLYRFEHALAKFNHSLLYEHLKKFEDLFEQYRQSNAELICARVKHKFVSSHSLIAKPATQLTQEEKEIKKKYSSGCRELEHEFNKTMRYKSIRSLADEETGVVIRDLKPVWVMSPLSISDTLPIDNKDFDVVIFDEASQIPLEEAIPAIYRAEQVIVVGDEMQLPPTTFFMSKETEDEELIIEDEGELIEFDMDTDSFLTQTAKNLPATMLGWHYRSRYESLISFSNCSFYDGNLLTIPEKNIWRQGGEIIVTNPEQALENFHHILNRSISYHFIQNGLYEPKKRRNKAEAEYIAYLVRELLKQNIDKSIGIVAFSEAQQEEIENAIETIAKRDSDFANLLEKESEKEKDDQFCGLFIKNLENVQGDERDIIILSVCYGFDKNHKMLMNFGPINKSGGEKRLNVVFSRAKYHMVVVSSIKYNNITNEYNHGANCLRNYLRYSEAISKGDLQTAETILYTIKPEKKIVRDKMETDAAVEKIKQKLEELGYIVERNIGQSDFRCDLAVRCKNDDCYKLGIMVDTADFYKNTDLIESYILKPQVLRLFGWKTVLVLAKDFYHNPDAVIKYLVKEIES